MNTELKVNIGQVKRDISDLVNRVAYGNTRVVLTSRGKPKAVLISVEDYERLKSHSTRNADAEWEKWKADAEALSQMILESRGGVPLDLDALWEAEKADQEARDDAIRGA
jgi:prevent-host-death family protein